MSRYLLDTNICVHYMKGDFGLIEKVGAIGFENCFLSEITIIELLFGVAKSDPTRQAVNRRNVEILRKAFDGQELFTDVTQSFWSTRSAWLCVLVNIIAP